MSGRGKFQFVGDDGSSQEQQQQQVTSIPSQLSAPSSLFNPSQFFQDYDTQNAKVSAYLGIPCIDGGATSPKCWIPITCMQLNQATPASWMEAIIGWFSSTSATRSIVIKKNVYAGSPTLWRWMKSGESIPKMTIAFVRKIALPSQASIAGNVNVATLEQDLQNAQNGGGVGLRNCRTKRGRRCSSNRDELDLECLFPFYQAALVLNAYCCRVSGGTMNAGDQCRSKTGGGCSVPCATYPSVSNPVTWEGGPGLTGLGTDWQVQGIGPNYPDPAFEHGLSPLAQEQIQFLWSSLQMGVEVRNPLSGKRYVNDWETVPV